MFFLSHKFLETNISEGSTAADISNAESMVVESGPVQYADQEHEEENDEEDDDIHMSAAQLMGQEYGHGEISCNFFGFLSLRNGIMEPQTVSKVTAPPK